MLRYARKESLKSTFQPAIGAVLAKGGHSLAGGFNKLRTASRGGAYTTYPESLHAERDCCIKVHRDTVQGCDLFIWREYKNGSPALARPCKDCQRLIKDLGIHRVIYSIPEFPYYKIERW